MVGGLNDTTGKAENNFTVEQFDSLATLLTQLTQVHPKATVLGHRDLSPDTNGNGKVDRNEWLKECPCFDVIPWWNSYL
jgi:N-acetyl-anhydromuramyl-L-alanine amidase AmpD